MTFFFILLFIVAFLYASVGHGGASGYIALMVIWGIAPAIVKPTALLLNIFVSAVAFLQFYRGGHFRWKLFWPFAVVSIPMAFVGGRMIIESDIYKKILGVLLLFPVLRFFFLSDPGDDNQRKPNLYISLLIGGAIGLISGMIGIGGGILLSPIVLFLHWANQKQAAALSALFIFVNSISGLAGQLQKGFDFKAEMILYVIVAFAGGILGAWFGSLKFKHVVLKQTLAIVLLIASIKLILT